MGTDVFGYEIQLPGLFHCLNVSIGIVAAATTDIMIRLAKIPIPIRPTLLLANSRLISDELTLLILFSPLDQNSHKVNLQQVY